MITIALIIAGIALQVRAAQAFRQSANSPDDYGWVMSDEAARQMWRGILNVGCSLLLFLVAAYLEIRT